MLTNVRNVFVTVGLGLFAVACASASGAPGDTQPAGEGKAAVEDPTSIESITRELEARHAGTPEQIRLSAQRIHEIGASFDLEDGAPIVMDKFDDCWTSCDHKLVKCEAKCFLEDPLGVAICLAECAYHSSKCHTGCSDQPTVPQQPPKIGADGCYPLHRCCEPDGPGKCMHCVPDSQACP